ncbi:MAG: Mur ligase domain-containing protein [Clostridium fessum]
MKLKSWLKELPYTLLQGSLETEVDEVVYDSRKAAPGTVFVCMRGANVDSHTFIPDVVEKGAPVLVVEHPVEAPGERDGHSSGEWTERAIASFGGTF